MREKILQVLERRPHRWTPAAIGWTLGRPIGGALGTEADAELEGAARDLAGAGELVVLPACPVCGRLGELLVLPANADEAPDAPAPISDVDLLDTMEPLIAEGVIEVSEIVEFEERECCVRTTRPWRRSPRPA